MTTTYTDFLASKAIVVQPDGKHVSPDAIHDALYPFQQSIVQWACGKGRAAIFADTGLGKSRMQLEWARQMGKPTLFVAPLAVAQQTVREARVLGMDLVYARSQDAASRFTITNYEMVDKFDASLFGAVVLDESSILKSIDGKIKQQLIDQFRDTPYRLCCTATPAPNDISELANHCEFLGVMSRVEMLSAFFVHDDDGWRLKGHARQPFFRWLASWAMSLKNPSDLGFDDAGYDLPPLAITPEIVSTDYVPEGQLFATVLKGVSDRAHVRKRTVQDRVAAAVELIRADDGQPWIVWTGRNDESESVTKAIPDAVEVTGSQSPEQKADALARFAAGDFPVLVTKPEIAGFGMNFQHCARMVFVGLSDSYEQYYQAIRRCYRFGQTRPVNAYIVLTDLEETIYHNVLRKETEAQAMQADLVRAVASYERAELRHETGKLTYLPTVEMTIPAWLEIAA
jgi:superfamily II DNA or RNA helicase